MLDWKKIKDHKTEKFSSSRVIIYTPDVHETYAYRIVDVGFVRICSDATHWAPMTPPKE